jgi:hypothetical protein
MTTLILYLQLKSHEERALSFIHESLEDKIII